MSFLKRIIKSFDCCGETSQSNLHGALQKILSKHEIVADYVDIFHPTDNMDCFDPDDDRIFYALDTYLFLEDGRIDDQNVEK